MGAPAPQTTAPRQRRQTAQRTGGALGLAFGGRRFQPPEGLLLGARARLLRQRVQGGVVHGHAPFGGQFGGFGIGAAGADGEGQPPPHRRGELLVCAHAPGFQERTAPAPVARITPVTQGQFNLAAQAAQGARAAFGLLQATAVLGGKPRRARRRVVAGVLADGGGRTPAPRSRLPVRSLRAKVSAQSPVCVCSSCGAARSLGKAAAPLPPYTNPTTMKRCARLVASAAFGVGELGRFR